MPRQRTEPSSLQDAQDKDWEKFTIGKENVKAHEIPSPRTRPPQPAPLAPTHPRDGLPGVEMGPAPRLRGLLQLPPPPPPSRRRALSPSRCSAGCHCRAKPGRRAVPGLGVCCPAAPGPPPRGGRPFSTADSGQPARWERRQAEKSRAPRSARWSVSLSVAGVPRAASSFLQPPPHPPKEASSDPRDSAPTAKDAARGHPLASGGPNAPPSARSQAGIRALFPPSGLDKDDLSVAGRRRAAESTAQPLKMHDHGPEPDPALRALSRPNRGQRGLAFLRGPAGRGPWAA